MLTGRDVDFPIVMYFSWRPLLAVMLISLIVTVVYSVFGLRIIGIPFLPVATIGTAVAFYVGFKNNSSYERLWEARKIWGAITNISRSWAALCLSLIGNMASSKDNGPVVQELIYRHLAWVNQLRIQLRKHPTCDSNGPPQHAQVVQWRWQGSRPDERTEDGVVDFLPADEVPLITSRHNRASAILLRQFQRIAELKQSNVIDGFEHSDMQKLLVDCFDKQGAAERTKSFPFPRQYAYFSILFVRIFSVLMPFALIGELARFNESIIWLNVPLSVLISWIFYTMERVGDTSEDPYDNGLNDVPLSAICRNIEIDLKEMLGDHDIPDRILPVRNILL